jgi:anthranilate phosphoribosyltransferase
MRELLKEVARGKKGTRDSTCGEAFRAAGAIVTGRATPARIGAFLAAEGIKTESAAEILGFVDALRPFCRRLPIPRQRRLCRTARRASRSFLATFPAAFVLSARGASFMERHSEKWRMCLIDTAVVKTKATEA